MIRHWLFVFVLLAGVSGCGKKPEPLPILGMVPDFELTAETGESFHGKLLVGRVWIADFIFTSCQGPCPRMSGLMRMIQKELTGVQGVTLVSFTVDPDRDTPEVLAAYGKRYQAEPGRWRFLTGAKEALHHLSRDAFRLGDVDGGLNHSSRFVVVDRKGRIRGYYGTGEDGNWKQVVPDVRRLLEEKS